MSDKEDFDARQKAWDEGYARGRQEGKEAQKAADAQHFDDVLSSHAMNGNPLTLKGTGKEYWLHEQSPRQVREALKEAQDAAEENTKMEPVMENVPVGWVVYEDNGYVSVKSWTGIERLDVGDTVTPSPLSPSGKHVNIYMMGDPPEFKRVPSKDVAALRESHPHLFHEDGSPNVEALREFGDS